MHEVEMQTLQDMLKRTEEELATLQMATLATEQLPREDNNNDVEEDPSSPRIVKVLLLIEAGTESSSISYELEQSGIIDDATTFEDYLTANDLSKKIQTGEYMLDSSISRK